MQKVDGHYIYQALMNRGPVMHLAKAEQQLAELMAEDGLYSIDQTQLAGFCNMCEALRTLVRAFADSAYAVYPPEEAAM